MLRGLRQATSNWIGKLVMGAVVTFLVLSFVIWGIGDIFRGFGHSTVATIGKSEISIEQFRQIYNDQLQQYARRLGRPIPPEQARAAGLDQQILAAQIAEAALDERARQLGLAVSTDEIVQQITKDPAFAGINGRFDQQRFLYLIRQAGFSEQRFIEEQRRVTLRRQLAGSVAGEIAAPKTAAMALDRFAHEKRDIAYVTVDAAAVGELPAPTDEELQKLYTDKKFLFRAPEYRKVLLLTVSPEAVAKSIEVTDADAKQAYEARAAQYRVPEKRRVQQISFPSAEEAKAAADRLAGGLSFEALAAERNVAPTDLDLGLVAKSDMLDPAIADAAFALKEGEVSGPVEGRFTNAIVEVTAIQPASVTPFPEVEAKIKADLALERAKAQVGDLRDKVEDELAAGSRLDEIAAKLKLPVEVIDAVDRSGRAPDGQPVELPKEVDVIGPAFQTQAGVENEAVRLPSGGYLWYEVAGVTPSRDRTFDEVKDKVEERWRLDKTAERVAAKASEIVGKVKAGTPLAEAAQADNLAVATAWGLERNATAPVPASVVSVVFETPKDGVASAEGASQTQHVVFQVTAITEPTFDPDGAETKKQLDALKRAYADDLMTQYIAQLQSDLGVEINQAAFAQATGRSGSDSF
ncbi:SurA N-terminal domain-containing protein [Rhodovulum sp. PH10]|uniref:SurA N-terminal domain-containing protein n=1 Tax=Rhodovulum sp. PH10 TaxID=1187851 RepID=UPI0005917F85|nr:SurA N-terminal domain-containing protein [Rhodovulum sp. PH10]